ncbi:conserved hypothetical protein [Histoplasma capsulatum var. duboisii H88]|uniref:Uncharacterized protein n=1 Tax=Ajellomyces capsulatus (strain H88) TaxID=544711 RepID=F0U4Z0_AJEC8|nr:conserved hypothetical protein [Histoplasma capsulatum var. duboisii H88]
MALSVLPSFSTCIRRMSRSSSDSSALSKTAKFETKQLSGPNCWACNTCSPHICRVVAQEDIQVDFIPLPSAARIYFIEFELRDRERCRPSGRGWFSCPAPSTDSERLQKFSTTKFGGLYRRVFLNDYLHGSLLLLDFLRSFVTSKVWHGNPVAPFSPSFNVVDARIRRQLTQMFDLYFGDESAIPIDQHLRDIYKLDVQPASKRPRDEEDDSAGDLHKRLKEKTVLAGVKTGVPTGSGTKFQARQEQFILRPSTTASEVIQRYASVLAASSSFLDE